jgi:phenylacetate-CoA ligase
MYVNSELCYLEFETDEGTPAIGKPANIISTGPENYAFPLIRYHTEDVGINHGYPEGATANYEVIEIIGGRGKDLLLGKDGLISLQVSRVMKSGGFDRQKRVQLEQRSRDELIVRVVPTAAFDYDHDPGLLEKLFTDHFQGEFKIAVEVVDQIDRTAAGKYKMVISPLAIEHLRQTYSRKP